MGTMSIMKSNDMMFSKMMEEQRQFHLQHQQQWQQMQQQMLSSSNISTNNSNRTNASDKWKEVQIQRKGISGADGRSDEAPVVRPSGGQVAKVKVGTPPKYEGDGKDELFP